MDLSKLTYSKEGSETRAEAEPISKPEPQNEEAAEPFISPNVPRTYRKPESPLSANLVFVLSGGEKREKDFLHELICQRKIRSLRVAFMSEEGQGLQPYQMKAKWDEIKKTGRFKIDNQPYFLDSADRVFLLSDVDEFYGQLEKFLKDEPDNELCKWIVSNPCFEIWLYYCYKSNPHEDLKCLESEPVASRSQKLKMLGQTIVQGGMNPRKAFELMPTGIENSRAHYSVDGNGIPALYATQMHEVAQYLVNTMNQHTNEYAEFVKEKEERRKEFKAKSTAK